MNTARILVVEDDAAVRNMIAAALDMQGYAYALAETGGQGIAAALSDTPDILLLDLGLPDMDGTEVITRIREWSSMPILIISARGDDRDKVNALDAGADDYLTKPFSVDELLARLRSTLRRLQYPKPAAEAKTFSNGELLIDYSAGCAYLDGQEVHLTPIEFRLICLLAQNVGKVLSYPYIMREIWGTTWDNDIASLRVYMAALRKKIETDPTKQRYIQTHVGVGYRMLRIE